MDNGNLEKIERREEICFILLFYCLNDPPKNGASFNCKWDFACNNDLNDDRYEKIGRKTNTSRYMGRMAYKEYSLK